MLLPFAGYYFVKYASKDAVHMPRRYFFDSPGNALSKDTAWHRVVSPVFTNQYGKKVTLDSARGKIIVMDFFFTSCPTICPGLARNMKKLQQSFQKNDSIVQFISVSVDPERDSVPRLRAFADKYDANHDNWWFVTGNKKEIYDFALQEMKANIADPGIDTAFIHTEYFYLLDTAHVVRGFYNGFDQKKLGQLAQDIPTLLLEKTKNNPSIFRQFIPYLPVIFIGVGLVIFITAGLSRSKNKQEKKYST